MSARSSSAVDYDQIASSYDRRYEQHDHGDVSCAVLEFVGEDPGSAVLEVACGVLRPGGELMSIALDPPGTDPVRSAP